MPIYLVIRRFEQFAFVRRVRCGNRCRRHHPDAHAFLTARVDIARHAQRGVRIRRMEAAAMLVIQSLLAAHAPSVFLRKPSRLRGPMRLRRAPSRAWRAGPCCTNHLHLSRARILPSRVDLAIIVRATRFVPLQIGIGQGDAENPACSTVASTNEFLAQVVVRDALDAPRERLAAVDRVSVAWADIISTGHHQRFTACCTRSFCACVPFIMASEASKPWR